MKVLIIKTSALGDIVHATPVIRYLHGTDATLRIDWLVEEPFAPLLENQPLIHTVHRIATKRWRRPENLAGALIEIARAIGLLRKEKYDVILDLQGNSKSGLFTLFSGAPLRYGFARDAVREWTNLLASNRGVAIGTKQHHISDRALKMAATAFPGGTMADGAAALTVDRECLLRVRDKLRQAGLLDRKLVLLHPGTTWKTKQMSCEFWQQLITALNRNAGVNLLFSWGTRRERNFIMKLQQAASERSTVWPKVSLPEFMALAAQVDVVLGGDTGPVHIAAALGTPTISFYRATDRRRNGPRGPSHCTFQSSMECSPCLLKTCPRNPACSNSIEFHRAVQAVDAILKMNS